MTDQPEPCISGRCLSPLACSSFGYCRDRNQYHEGEPSEAQKAHWRNVAAKLGNQRASTEDIAKRLSDVVAGWPHILPPNAFVQVRADMITAALIEIEGLRHTISPGK